MPRPGPLRTALRTVLGLLLLVAVLLIGTFLQFLSIDFDDDPQSVAPTVQLTSYSNNAPSVGEW